MLFTSEAHHQRPALPVSSPTPAKRKAVCFDDNDNTENIEPLVSPKRAKAPDGSSKEAAAAKSTHFHLTTAPPSPNDHASSLKPVLKSAVAPRRPILSARAPSSVPRVSAVPAVPAIPQITSAPAGRSPTRQRIGLLSRRRTSSPFTTRVEPPRFSTRPSGLSFSIDAALSGTIPSYKPSARKAATAHAPTPASTAAKLDIPELHVPASRPTWFFEIHEDTAEELATNLMEHSTCTLDLSSDEESNRRERDDRGKENIAPLDDVSQTRSAMPATKTQQARQAADEDAIELDRAPLAALAAEHFYADGCDEKSIFVVPADYVELEASGHVVPAIPALGNKGKQTAIERDVASDIDILMQKPTAETASEAAVLQPLEKAEEDFQLWESGSANEEE